MIARNSLISCHFRLNHIGLIVLFSVTVAFKSQAAPEPADSLPYAEYFNPQKGFRPVQPNLGKAFLQLAGSLESTGSPEAYLRHIVAEHKRIDAKHQAAGGKGSSRPAYLTDEYVDSLIANWNKIAPTLKLDAFCRDAGRNIRYAILGSQNMSRAELAALEQNLTEPEHSTYSKLLGKPFFTKADFPAMEAFYNETFDKLTEIGKDQISRRTKLGTLPPEEREKVLATPPTGTALVRLINEHQDKTVAFLENGDNPKANADTLQATLIKALRLDQKLAPPKDLRAFDAEPLIYSHKIRDEYMRRIEAVRKTAQTPKQATMIEKAMRLMLENLVVIAQSEFEAGLYDKPAKARESGD